MNMPAKIVAIHQPNFFPWLGFFHKIYASDIFVVLNHVENNPRTAIYTKRVKIIANRQEFWLTCSLKNEPGRIFMPINEMVIDKPDRLKDKQLKTIELNYKKYPFYSEAAQFLDIFYDHKSDLIAERNQDTINAICDKLNITTKKVVSSDMQINSSSTQLLIDIIKQLGGDCYMPGGGAQGYQEDDMFKNNGIELRYQNFQHPQYEQKNSDSFIPGLSIIDTIMNIGLKETENLIKNA
jgi:hypothetical protein